MNGASSRDPKCTANESGAVPFLSLALLKARHKNLLECYPREQRDVRFQDDVVAFVCQGRTTGKLLDSSDDRWATQNLLDYWNNVLYRAGREVHSAVLDKFDSELVKQYVSRADEFCEQLSTNEQGRVRHILLSLVQADRERMVTCKSASLAELHRRMGGATADTDRILDGLIQAGILCRHVSDETGEERVEVAYEAIVHRWPRLADWLQDTDLWLLTQTVEHWASLGRDPQALCSGRLLAQALHHQDLDDLETEFVRESVAARLLEGGSGLEEIETPQLIHILIDLLSDPNPSVCFRAKWALERVASYRSDLAALAVADLIDLLVDRKAPIRAQAAGALEGVARVCPTVVTPQAIDVLVGLLSDPDGVVSYTAVYTLERVAEERPDLARQIATGVEPLLADSRDVVRVRAATVLEAVVRASPEVVTPQMVETVIGLFLDVNSDVCSRAQYVLEQIITTRSDMVLQIIDLLDGLLENKDSKVRISVMRSMEMVVQVSPEAAVLERVIVLDKLLKEGSETEGLQAEHVLKRMLEARPQLAYQITDLGAGRFSPVFPWYSVSLIRGVPPKDVNSPSLQAGSSGPHYEPVLSA